MPYTYCEQIGKEIRDISDEIPFDIPESWDWCRLSDLAIKEIKRGKSPVYADSGSVLVFAQKCNVKTGGINITLAKYLADSVISKYSQEEYVQDEDIIVNSTGTGTLGRIGVYSDKDNPDNIPLVPDSHVTIVRVNADLSQYIYYILKWYQPYLEECGEGSTKQKELKPDRIKELFIPIPPVSEQHRIVSKIKELLPYIDKYGKAEEHLTALNTTFPEALKKSILQEAVQGKLVPQNPDDEPASVLLERIRAEKQVLIKAGKIKKDKHESVIITRDKIPYEIIDGKEHCIADEVPFELPESWCWCRLSDLAIKEIKRGKSPVYADSGSVLVFAQKCNVKTGGINITLAKYLADSAISKYSQEEYVQDKDIIVNSTGTGTLGRIGLYSFNDNPDNMPLVPDSHVTIVRVNSDLSKYIYYILKWYQPYLEECGEGSTKQKELKADRIKELFIPIPPLSEQKQIVQTIESTYSYCNKL